MKEEIEIIIDGAKLKAKHRTFNSGRKGYGAYGTVNIDGKGHRVSLNLIEM